MSVEWDGVEAGLLDGRRLSMEVNLCLLYSNSSCIKDRDRRYKIWQKKRGSWGMWKVEEKVGGRNITAVHTPFPLG